MGTYASLQTDICVGNQFDATADATVIQFGLREAYRRVWYRRRDWDFRRVGPTSLTVAAGVETPTLPVDGNAAVVVGEVFEVYDDQGFALERMPPDRFDRVFQPDMVADNRYRPVAWKWQNGTLTLGPRPDSDYTFTFSYDRKLGYLAAGTTFTAGYMASSEDQPAWDAAHHGVLVWGAREIAGEALASDLASVAAQEFEAAIQVMEQALELDAIPPGQWPADRSSDAAWDYAFGWY